MLMSVFETALLAMSTLAVAAVVTGAEKALVSTVILPLPSASVSLVSTSRRESLAAPSASVPAAATLHTLVVLQASRQLHIGEAEQVLVHATTLQLLSPWCILQPFMTALYVVWQEAGQGSRSARIGETLEEASAGIEMALMREVSRGRTKTESFIVSVLLRWSVAIESLKKE
jgi:hypothetical protein